MKAIKKIIKQKISSFQSEAEEYIQEYNNESEADNRLYAVEVLKELLLEIESPIL